MPRAISLLALSLGLLGMSLVGVVEGRPIVLAAFGTEVEATLVTAEAAGARSAPGGRFDHSRGQIPQIAVHYRFVGPAGDIDGRDVVDHSHVRWDFLRGRPGVTRLRVRYLDAWPATNGVARGFRDDMWGPLVAGIGFVLMGIAGLWRPLRGAVPAR